MKIILKHVIFISLLIIIVSYGYKQEDIKRVINTAKSKTLQPNSRTSKKKEVAELFTHNLKNGHNLVKLMDDNWTLLYYADDRCSGSTEGEKINLSKPKIDKTVIINVKNDSEYAWACDKRAPYYYDFTFDLNKQIKNWDNFELQSSDYSDSPKKEKDVFYILGAGDSDYIKLTIGAKNLITKLKYSSIDPG